MELEKMTHSDTGEKSERPYNGKDFYDRKGQTKIREKRLERIKRIGNLQSGNLHTEIYSRYYGFKEQQSSRENSLR